MHLTVVHLSDLHVKDESNPVLQRGAKIAAAIRSSSSGSSAILLIWTGDIAFSGKASEYEVVSQLFAELKLTLRSLMPEVTIYIVGLPGNHDCDLIDASDARDIPAIQHRLETLSISGDVIRHCLAVQTNFFKFLQEIDAVGQTTVPSLAWQAQFSICGEKIAVNCYNTAWLTQNPERPGQLCFPIRASSAMDAASGATVVISAFHHPYNWLMPDNARKFKVLIESTSDVVLTGHEHEADSYTKSRPTGAVNFVEGAALWNTDDATSAFNVISIDTAGQTYRVMTYSWMQDLYEPKPDAHTFQFMRNPSRLAKELENTESYAEYLSDLGTGYTHPRKDELGLYDLFVCPSLHKGSLQKKIEGSTGEPSRIRSNEARKAIIAAGKAIIIGADRCGKTTLAKMLYRYGVEMGMVPLFLSPSDVGTPDPNEFARRIDTAIGSQYGVSAIGRFRQLHREKILVIIDDFHKARLTRKGQRRILDACESLANYVVVLVSDTFPIDELTSKDTAVHPFRAYQQFEIESFGRVLRGELIERWVRLGQDYAGDEAAIVREIDHKEKLIQGLLSKQAVPSYPVIILGLLQACEAGRMGLDRSTGSYGELFEALITERFRRISVKATDIGTKYTIVSRIAFSMFEKNRRRLTPSDLRNIISEYFVHYRVSIDESEFISQLLEAMVLTEVGGTYEFKYPYYYHYFVARYLHQNMSDLAEQPRLAGELQRMTNRVYRDDYVDIVVFYLYLSRDLEIIERICGDAQRIYGKYPPCDLEADVEFVNRLYLTEPEPIALPPSDVEDNRRTQRSEMEAMEEAGFCDKRKDEEVEYAETLDELVKLNIAFKTIYILGQVLRSFPGVLKQDRKVRIARECYLLGLRVMSVILRVASDNLNDLRQYFAEVFREHQGSLTSRDVAVDADEMVIWLTGVCSFGIVKRLSLAVGHEDLGETYKDVLALEKKSLAVQVIDLSIKLDHFTAIPEDEIEYLRSRTKKNYFVYSLVRDLVRQYLTIFRVESGARQRIMKLLKIEDKGPQLLTMPLIKEKS